MSPEYDLLIIGGGPGGSVAAACARQQGLRTLVVEKAEFPRFHVGESLLPMGNAVLREIGVWPKIAAAGFIPKFGAEFHTADGTLTKYVVFAESLVPGLDQAFQVERSRFDALLLDHARELGADVRMRTAVTMLQPEASGIRVAMTGTDGDTTLTVPWVIDSTGRDASLTTPQKRSLEPAVFPKRMAIFSHFRGVARAEGRAAGNIRVVRLDGGWFWIIPIDAERTSVGLVCPVEQFRASGCEPAEYFQQAIGASTKLTELMCGAARMLEFHVTSDYSYFRTRLAQERLLLVGDAAGFLDPVFSSGVHLATWSAQQAVAAMARAHREQRGLTAREQLTYTAKIKRHAKVFERLIHAFYDDHSFEVFMCQQIPFDLSRGMTSIVAGHARLTWPLWWRYQLFLLVCRLQPRFKLVKRPEPAPVPAPA